MLIWPAAAGVAAQGRDDAAASGLAAAEKVVAYLSLQRNPRDVTIAALGEATNSVTAVIYKFDDPVLMAPIRATIAPYRFAITEPRRPAPEWSP